MRRVAPGAEWRFIYGLRQFPLFSSHFPGHLVIYCGCSLRPLFWRRIFGQRFWAGVRGEDKPHLVSRSPWGTSLPERRFARELESARTNCAGGAIGGGATVSSLSAEDGDAGCTRGRAPAGGFLHRPVSRKRSAPYKKHNERRAFAIVFVQPGVECELRSLDAGGAGSTCLRCYRRRNAGLQLGVGARYIGAD